MTADLGTRYQFRHDTSSTLINSRSIDKDRECLILKQSNPISFLGPKKERIWT